MKAKIFCFGNPLIKEDTLPLKLAEDLQKKFPHFEFIKAYSSEDIEGIKGELIIIDTVLGIKKVTLLSDKDIHLNKIYSLHDFDIGISIKLMKKIGIVKKVKILGIPYKYQKQKALKELIFLIKKNLRTDSSRFNTL